MMRKCLEPWKLKALGKIDYNNDKKSRAIGSLFDKAFVTRTRAHRG